MIIISSPPSFSCVSLRTRCLSFATCSLKRSRISLEKLSPGERNLLRKKILTQLVIGNLEERQNMRKGKISKTWILTNTFKIKSTQNKKLSMKFWVNTPILKFSREAIAILCKTKKPRRTKPKRNKWSRNIWKSLIKRSGFSQMPLRVLSILFICRLIPRILMRRSRMKFH